MRAHPFPNKDYRTEHPLAKAWRGLLGAAAALLPAATLGGVIVTDNSTWPSNPVFQTFANTEANVSSERDVRFTRNLAQTFQLLEPTTLHRLFVSYEEGLAVKEFTVRIFTVADVNAATLLQPDDAGFAGQVYVNFTHTTGNTIETRDAGNNPLGAIEFDLTDADEVTLPANTGSEGYCFQLVRTGTGADLDVPEQRAFKWHFNDNGNLYPDGRAYAIVGGGLDAADEFAFAIAGPDVEAPTVADVVPATALNRLTVVFSENVTSETALNLANYSVAPGLTLSDPLLVNPRTVRFTTGAQTPGGDYTLTVNNIRDASSAGNSIAANTQVPFKALSLESGFLTAEFYRSILPRSTTVNGLLFWPAFQARTPDEVRYLPTASTPSGYGDDYGVAVYGVLVPKQSGQYFFFIRSDDNSSLYLNVNGPAIPDPMNDLAIAEEFDNGGPFMEPDTFDPATTVNPIQLEQGQKYGFLYLLKEGGTADFGQVAWRRVGDATPAASLPPISGEFFETYVDTSGNTLTITADPGPADAIEGRTATFTVQAASNIPADQIGYQWMRNGTDIPGATSATYILYPVPGGDNGAAFSVRVRVPGIVRTSGSATLTVTQDETAPTVASAKAGADRLSVDIVFSEPIDPATTTALANFAADNGLTLSNPEMINETTLRLGTSEQTIGTTYTITLNNVRDWAGNALAANTTVSFRGLGPYLQGDNGYVIWEAEAYHRLVGTEWHENTVAGQASGGVSMENFQGVGANEFGDHLQYDVLFTKIGRHYIWVRGGAERGDAGAADSVWLHVYPAGTTPARPAGRTAAEGANWAALTGFSGGDPNAAFVWARNAQEGPTPMYFDIAEPGVYTVGIGIREDGSFMDKFVITTNPNFTPTGTGPAATIRQGETPPADSTVTITTQPASRSTFANLPVAFTVVASSTDLAIGYQWQRKVGETWENIPNATAATFNLNPATLDWNGAVLRVVVSVTGASVTSNEVTLTVTEDNAAPTVLLARGRGDRLALTIVFSEAVDETSALNPANYTSPSLAIFDPVMVADRAVRFSTAEQVVGTEYTVTLNDVRDLAQNAVAANTPVRFFGVGPLAQDDNGFVTWEAEDYDRKLGTFWREENTAAPASGGLAMTTPDNISDNEYNDHLEFDVMFNRAGLHTIYIRGRAGDNAAGGADSVWLHVYPAGTAAARPSNRLNSNDAGLAGFNNVNFVWGSDAVTGSDPQTFDIPAPGLYTIGIGSREDGSYADKFFVRPPGSTFVPTNLGPLETARQGEPAVVAEVTIASQPASITVVENRSARFDVAFASNDPLVLVQWQRKAGANWEDIAGATATSYSIAQATEDMSGSVYRARISATGRELFSDEATLTVSSDSTAPIALSAGAFATEPTVGIAFNETINPAAPGTYVVNGGAATAVAVYMERYVKVSLGAFVPDNFTVTISGAQDLAGNVMPDTTITGRLVSGFDFGDLGAAGDPIEGGEAFTWGSGFYVAGGGSDIFGNADHGFFVYREFTGPFDVRARVDRLIGGDEWGKATLMARESVAAGARNQAVLITKTAPYIPPTTGGMNVYNMQWRDTTDGASGSTATALRISPTVFPSWIRLVRENAESNQMDSYISYDGENWIRLDSHTTPAPTLPATLVIGMAVTSHDNAPGFPRAEVIYENFSLETFGDTGPFDPELRIAQEGGSFVIRWNSGTLVSSPTLDGIYQPVNAATSPYTIPAGSTTQFYQVTR